MFTTPFIFAAALIAAGSSAPLQPRACTPGQYNCLDGKSFQQCVVGGTWSVTMQSAAGTTCYVGISANPWLPVQGGGASAPAPIASSAAASSPPQATTLATQAVPISSVTSAAASQHTDSPPPPPPVASATSAAASQHTDSPPPPPAVHTTSATPAPTVSATSVATVPATAPASVGQFAELATWPSWNSMKAKYKNVMGTSCQASWNVANNSPEETQEVFDAIEANSGSVDKRYLLAIVIQESSGCVRVPTTNNGVVNPGLLQDSNGASTCNNGGIIQNPCPKAQINGMIKDGVSSGDNNFTKALATATAAGYQGAMAYAVAARIYNSGSYDASNLSNGLGSTASYVISVMARVAGKIL